MGLLRRLRDISIDRVIPISRLLKWHFVGVITLVRCNDPVIHRMDHEVPCQGDCPIQPAGVELQVTGLEDRLKLQH